jgi:hypothetical protein
MSFICDFTSIPVSIYIHTQMALQTVAEFTSHAAVSPLILVVVLRVELDDLRQVGGTGVAVLRGRGQPQQVLEQQGVDGHRDPSAGEPPPRGRQQPAHRPGVQHGRVDVEHAPLLVPRRRRPDLHPHRALGRRVEAAVPRSAGRRGAEEEGVAAHGARRRGLVEARLAVPVRHGMHDGFQLQSGGTRRETRVECMGLVGRGALLFVGASHFYAGTGRDEAR